MGFWTYNRHRIDMVICCHQKMKYFLLSMMSKKIMP